MLMISVFKRFAFTGYLQTLLIILFLVKIMDSG
jgi:hypothetical protein